MKKIVLMLAAAAVLSLGLNGVIYAEDAGWAAAAGFAGGVILGSAVSYPHYYGCRRYYYYPEPVYYSSCYSYPVYTSCTTYSYYQPYTTYYYSDSYCW